MIAFYFLSSIFDLHSEKQRTFSKYPGMEIVLKHCFSTKFPPQGVK